MDERDGDRDRALAVRVGDRERDAVVERLHAAHATGHLDVTEWEERVDRALAARTHGDLSGLTDDLPGDAALLAPVSETAPTQVTGQPGAESSVAVLGDTRQEGPWRMASRHRGLAVLGDVRLDLRAATLESRESWLSCTAVLGDVTVVVPSGWEVHVERTAVLGDVREQGLSPAVVRPGAPVLRVQAVAVLGDVTVVHAEPDGSVPSRRGLRRARKQGRGLPPPPQRGLPPG